MTTPAQPTSNAHNSPLPALVQLAVATDPVNDSKESNINPNSSPIELIKWGINRFANQRILLTTSFGMEGCALIDIWSKQLQQLPDYDSGKFTVAYIDTGFFFPETLALKQRIVERYPNINIEAWKSSVTIEKQKVTYGDNLWESNPNLCCHLRKVVPMSDNIRGNDIWVTAVRRSQTEQRKTIDVLNWDWRYQILKFCPFANWTRADTWKYVKEHDVPFNELHLNGFPSIGCYHCTKAVPGSTPETDTRDGRWKGNDKTECGLHYSI